jgi:hypothetical protein
MWSKDEKCQVGAGGGAEVHGAVQFGRQVGALLSMRECAARWGQPAIGGAVASTLVALFEPETSFSSASREWSSA